MTLLKDITEIRKCIKNWNTIRKKPSELKQYLSIADSFSYKHIYSSTKNLHVYPGICFETETFYMFLIDAEMDKAKRFDQIIQSKVGSLINLENPLPSRIALSRIETWKEKKDSWIDKQVKTSDGIFEAFNLPSDYMKQSLEYETFFSLEANDKSESGYDADLITREKVFYDVVRPVPPFGGKNPPKKEFNLL